ARRPAASAPAASPDHPVPLSFPTRRSSDLDRARKENLVNYGFRLPSALDNRPLKFSEWENIFNQVIFVSATPGDYELEKSEGVRSEEHTSELQSRENLVCRLLLEKKK